MCILGQIINQLPIQMEDYTHLLKATNKNNTYHICEPKTGVV